MDGLPRCQRHPAARAGWICRACGAALCPGCAYEQRAGTGSLVACGRCQGLADPVTLPRAVLRPFAPRLLPALLFPLEGGGLMVVAAAAAVFTLLSWLGVAGRGLAFGLTWALLFSVIRLSARGSAALEAPEFDSLLDDVALPAIRGLLGTAVIWAPALAWVLTVHMGRPDHSLAALAADPVVWLLLLAGVLYAPAALTVAAISGSTVQMLNPLLVIGAAVRLGGDYLLLVAALGGLALLDLALMALGVALTALPVPLLPTLLARALGLYAPIVMARLSGLLLHVRGDVVGYGHAGDYLEPAMPGAAPRGAPPVPETTAVEPEPRAPMAPIELPDEGPVVGAASGPPAAPPPPGPDPQALFEEARAASLGGDHARAAELLRVAGLAEDHPVAPTAWLVLGRLYRSKLGEPEAARQVFEYVAARWPDGEPARQARAALAQG